MCDLLTDHTLPFHRPPPPFEMGIIGLWGPGQRYSPRQLDRDGAKGGGAEVRAPLQPAQCPEAAAAAAPDLQLSWL